MTETPLIQLDPGSGGFGYRVMMRGEMFVRQVGGVVPDSNRWVFRPSRESGDLSAEALLELAEQMVALPPPTTEQLDRQLYWATEGAKR